MDGRGSLGWLDWTVIAITLVISATIGIVCGFLKRNKQTTKEYILAGKDMSKLPVIMSISVTLVTGTTMIGNPAEIYKFGAQYLLIFVGAAIGIFLVTVLFLPVYFQLGVSSIYEFLEVRYGKTTRFVASGLFVIQMTMFTSVILFAPALALNAVTNISIELSILLLGLACTVYSTVGGLRGVLWTDVFQAGVIFFCLVAMYIKGIMEIGGLGELFRRSSEGQRLNIFNTSVNMMTRYTIWNVALRGMLGGLAYYGTSQVEVQRMLSMKTLDRAKSALRWSILSSQTFLTMCNFLGLILYSVFYKCNPVSDKENTGITRYDQIVPYFIVTRFSSLPGLSGLCIAGIFCGTLSSVSSILNSLSTVTIVDYVKPISKMFSINLSEKASLLGAKIMCVVYGIICISFAFCLSNTDSLLVAASTLASMLEGSLLALFLLGVLTVKGSEKAALIGLTTGVILTSWIAYGSLFSGYRSPPLPFDTSGCTSAINASLVVSFAEGNKTILLSTTGLSNDTFFLYKLSYQWLPIVGLLSTLGITLLCVALTGWNHNVIPSNSKCLCPITRFWLGSAASEVTENQVDSNSLKMNNLKDDDSNAVCKQSDF